jgi:hypothetical protein
MIGDGVLMAPRLMELLAKNNRQKVSVEVTSTLLDDATAEKPTLPIHDEL